MAQTSNDRKFATNATKKVSTTRWRWSSASLKRYSRWVRYRSKIILFIYSTFYLVRHWFDFFLHPWTFDDIFMGQHVPIPVCIPIFVGAVAWSWRHRRPATFWSVCSTAVVVVATDIYFHLRLHDADLWRPVSLKSPLICALMLLSAAFGDRRLEPGQSSTAPAVHFEEDAEVARDAKPIVSHAGPPQASPGEPRSKSSSLMAYVSGRLPTIRTAAALSFIAAAATAIMHPPGFVDEYLSSMNCQAQFTKLDFDNQHFEFTAANKPSTFTRSCSETQQLWAIEKIMMAHVNESDATCGVWCVRRAEDGKWFGYISQVRGGLVDMHYCRGGYGSFGPDCEAEGEEYGYDVGKEGWMDDIYEPWSVLEEDTEASSSANEE